MGRRGRAFLVAMCVTILIACGGPGPTATPAFARYKAEDVHQALVAAGLPVTNWQDNAAAAQFIGPQVWIEDKSFDITPGVSNGVVMIFDTPRDLAAIQAWFARIPDLVPFFYVHGNAVVQVGGLPKLDAVKYQAALESLK